MGDSHAEFPCPLWRYHPPNMSECSPSQQLFECHSSGSFREVSLHRHEITGHWSLNSISSPSPLRSSGTESSNPLTMRLSFQTPALMLKLSSPTLTMGHLISINSDVVKRGLLFCCHLGKKVQESQELCVRNTGQRPNIYIFIIPYICRLICVF